MHDSLGGNDSRCRPSINIKISGSRRLEPKFLGRLVPVTHIQSYYKRNRHFQRYVVSKPLAQWTHNLRSSVEDRVFVPPLPVSLNELKQSITTAVASVDEDMLRSVWTELDYRIDMCRVTKGSHREHL